MVSPPMKALRLGFLKKAMNCSGYSIRWKSLAPSMPPIAATVSIPPTCSEGATSEVFILGSGRVFLRPS